MSDQKPKTNATGAHATPASEVLSALGVARDRGLDDGLAAERRRRHGANRLVQAKQVSLWRRLARHFRELAVWVLLLAAGLSWFLGDWIDAVAILAIVVLNGAIGFFQEEKAQAALQALRQLAVPMARVLRRGVWRSVPAGDVVPGDVIHVEAGDRVPADARLLEAFGLAVSEASLTGESVPVEKDAGALLPPTAALGDRKNLLFMGTTAATGRATAVVVATGMETELGRIAGLLAQEKDAPTPLQRRLAAFSRILILAVLVIVVILFSLQLARQEDWTEALLLSLSLAVAAVPEGLTAVVTISLALGLQRMVRRKALIRRLVSV